MQRSAISIMKFSLSISIVLPILLSKICEAQVVSLTLNIVESTTVTETTTLSVLGACFSFNSLASCRRHRHLHSSSLGEGSNQDNADALLYNPSAVEKLEVTIGPEEKKSLSNTDTEDPITIQSSSKSKQDSKTNFFSPIINDGTETTVNYNIQSLFAFFRPLIDAWSVAVGATSTFFHTITLTHTTIAYVKETTSTTTLLINACNDLAIMNSILLDHVPKCPIANHTTTESTTGSTSTMDGTPTTSRTTTLIIDETTPVSTNSSSIAPISSPIPTGTTVPSEGFNNTSPKPPVTIPTPTGTIDPIGPTDSSSTALTTTETFTQTVQLTTGIVCAKLVNVTGACRLRRNVWLEEPEILTFNEGMDDVLDYLLTPVIGIEETETTKDLKAHFRDIIQDSIVTDIITPSELVSSQNLVNDNELLHEKRTTSSSPMSYIMNLFNPLTSMLRLRRSAIFSVNTTTTVTSTLTTTDTVFIQKCTPLPFTISTCLRRR